MSKFLLVRHAEPLWSLNEQKKIKGAQRDFVPLSEKGIEQAKSVSADPRLIKASRVVSSPYTRALQTASIISSELNLPLSIEYDLHEWLPDITFQFETLEQINELHSDFLAHKGIYPLGSIKRWESTESVISRSKLALQKHSSVSETIIVITHGMVISALTG